MQFKSEKQKKSLYSKEAEKPTKEGEISTEKSKKPRFSKIMSKLKKDK
jgi:hypothetical protein